MPDNRKNVIILFFTLMVVMMGYSMVMPLIPFYIERFGASGKEMGFLIASAALMQFIFAPVWGSLSDRVGRKPIMLIGVLGYAVAMFLFGMATELWMLFAARLLYGVLSSAAMPTSMAYIADSTSVKGRSGGMGAMGASVGIGMIIGPSVSGILATDELATPFFVGTALALLAALLVIFLLPESLPVEKRSRQLANLGSNRWTQFKIALFSPVGILMALTFLVSFGMSNFQGVLGLYALDKFHFDTRQIGAMWTLVGALVIVGQGVITGILTRKFGEVTTIRISLLLTALGFIPIIYASSYLSFLAGTGFFILSISLLGPALNALVSCYSKQQQGTTMGINNAVMSLGKVIGPIWAGMIYDINFDFPFISGAVILLAGFIISVVYVRSNLSNNSPALED